MKIYSSNRNSWLSLSSNESEGGSFEVEVCIDIGHSTFHGKNADIYFLNFHEFIKEYDTFFTHRDNTPVLHGTYDSYIKFISKRNSVVFLSFCIGDAFSGYSETVKYLVCGEYELDSEYLNQIYDEFRRLSNCA